MFGFRRKRTTIPDSTRDPSLPIQPQEVARPVHALAPDPDQPLREDDPPLQDGDNHHRLHVDDSRVLDIIAEKISERLGRNHDRYFNSLRRRNDELLHELGAVARKRLNTGADKIALDVGRRMDRQARDLHGLIERMLNPLAPDITAVLTQHADGHWSGMKKEVMEVCSRATQQAAQRPIVDQLIALLDRIREERGFLASWYRKDPNLSFDIGARQLYERYDAAIGSLASESLMILRGLGVEQIDGGSGRFNPQIQEVVDVELTRRPELDGQVARIVRGGFLWNGAILRSERVVVYKKKENQTHEEKQS